MSNIDLLKKEILSLSNDLSIEKNNNQKLSLRIKELERINKLKGDQNSEMNVYMLNEELIAELNKKLKNFNNNFNANFNKDKIQKLLDEIKMKDKIISNYPVQLSKGEKMLSVIFASPDQKINYSVICKNTDIFNRIENIFYQAYPEYLKSENSFFVDGNQINKYKTLEFNKIKNNDIIVFKNI